MNANLIEQSNVWAQTIGPGWKADVSPGSEVEGALYIINGRVSLRKVIGNKFKYMYDNGILITATIDKKCCSIGNTHNEALDKLFSELYHHPEISYDGFNEDVAVITSLIK